MGTLLPSFQDRLISRLKDQGLLPMTTGITKALPQADSYDAAMSIASGEIDRAVLQFGARAGDRYSAGVGDSYRDQRYAFVAGQEGVKTKVYMDGSSPAIGLGFHLDTPNAKVVWKSAFGDTLSFDAVKSGQEKITPAQAKTLFDHSAVYYESLVDTAARGKPITQNQRVALFSIAYGAPKRFMEHVAPALQSGNDASVTDAILTKTFSPGNADLLKARRYSEARLFTSSQDADNIMPTFQAYDAAVQVDPKTGVTKIKAVGTADVSDMAPEFQKRLANMIDAAPAGIKEGLGVYSGYRSVEKQKTLFDAALKKYGSVAEARKWVAPPGNSQHGKGFAADLSYNGESLAHAPKDVVDWVHANAKSYGLTFPLANENWHIEPVEARKTGVLLPLTSLKPITGLKVTEGDPDAPIPHSPTQSLTAARQAYMATGFLPAGFDASTLDNPGPPPLVPSKWGNGIMTAVGKAGQAAGKPVENLGAPVVAKGPLPVKTVNVRLDGTTAPAAQAGETQLPRDMTLDPTTMKMVKVPTAPTPPPSWVQLNTAKKSGLLVSKVAMGGGAIANAGIVPSAGSVKAVAAPIPVSRPIVASPAPAPKPAAPKPATGTAQDGRYNYVKRADGSVIEINSGRVTAPAKK